jgi:malate permease and related proteins
MSNLILLIGCLLSGVLLCRLRGFPAQAHRGLNAFIIYLSLPALTLLYIPRLDLAWSLAYPIAMSWIVFIVAFFVFVGVGKWLRLDRRTVGCMVLCCGLGNTSFVGFPLIEQFYGQEGLTYAILCDQPGAFLVVATLVMAAVGYFTTGEVKLGDIGKRVINFPPFVAFVLSLLIAPLGGVPAWLEPLLQSLGSALTPLALVSVGLQLTLARQHFPPTAFSVGLIYKLLLAPALIWLLYVKLAGQSGLGIDVSILEAAMAPMITPSIIAMENNLNPPLASLFVGIGIPISLLTVYGWHAIL